MGDARARLAALKQRQQQGVEARARAIGGIESAAGAEVPERKNKDTFVKILETIGHWDRLRNPEQCRNIATQVYDTEYAPESKGGDAWKREQSVTEQVDDFLEDVAVKRLRRFLHPKIPRTEGEEISEDALADAYEQAVQGDLEYLRCFMPEEMIAAFLAQQTPEEIISHAGTKYYREGTWQNLDDFLRSEYPKLPKREPRWRWMLRPSSLYEREDHPGFAITLRHLDAMNKPDAATTQVAWEGERLPKKEGKGSTMVWQQATVPESKGETFWDAFASSMKRWPSSTREALMYENYIPTSSLISPEDFEKMNADELRTRATEIGRKSTARITQRAAAAVTAAAAGGAGVGAPGGGLAITRGLGAMPPRPPRKPKATYILPGEEEE